MTYNQFCGALPTTTSVVQFLVIDTKMVLSFSLVSNAKKPVSQDETLASGLPLESSVFVGT